jgi:hypothetical protein
MLSEVFLFYPRRKWEGYKKVNPDGCKAAPNRESDMKLRGSFEIMKC